MANKVITDVIEQLKKRHIELAQELNRIDDALSVLSSLSTNVEGSKALLKKAGVKSSKKKGKRAPLSPETKARMAEAARKRWAARKTSK